MRLNYDEVGWWLNQTSFMLYPLHSGPPFLSFSTQEEILYFLTISCSIKNIQGLFSIICFISRTIRLSSLFSGIFSEEFSLEDILSTEKYRAPMHASSKTIVHAMLLWRRCLLMNNQRITPCCTD